MAYQLGYFIILSLMSLKLAHGSLVITSADEKNVTVNFTSGVYTAYMNENNHEFIKGSKTPILKITHYEGIVRVMTTGTMFFYDLTNVSDTYILSSTQSFDYELNQRSYTFQIHDDSNENPTVLFTIINIDDEPPTLTSPQCSFLEKRTFTNITSNCSAIVGDPDGWLAQMTFNVINYEGGNEHEIFALEYRDIPGDEVYTAPVYMTVRQPLLYEKKTFYLFNIEAKDGAGHATTPDPLVRAMITVIDTRGNPPVWTKYVSDTEYTEQTVKTYQVQARDGDSGINAAVYYEKLSEQEDYEGAKYISIDKNTGVITVTNIDRDKHDISTYSFTIRAYVDPERKWYSNMTITLHVVDIDNNPPIIRNSTVNQTIIYDFDSYDKNEEKVVHLKFRENYASSLNTSTIIRDIDTGENAEFTVQLVDLPHSKVEYTKAFFVAPNAGYKMEDFELSVRNSKPLDYENPDYVNFQFYMLVEGLLNNTKRDQLLVNISLIDYNDEWPIFKQTEYETSINETAKDGTFIIQIMATDRDAEDKILKHTLRGSSFATEVLRIESATGKIYVKGDNVLDYDKLNPIFVQVVATDKVNHTASASLTINLLDVNNKQPSITSEEIIYVEENQITGSVLNSSIKASDPDTTANLTAEIDWHNSFATKNSRRILNETEWKLIKFLDVRYRISHEDDKYPNRKIIIELVVNDNNPNQTTPVFQIFDSLFLSLKVIDWNTDPEFLDKMNKSESILITIVNINSNAPYFPNSEIDRVRTIQEIQDIGTSAGVIQAIDLDVTNILIYNCTALNKERDWVQVNSGTGEFTVKHKIICDYPHPVWNISYECNAFNHFHYSEPATILFTILDYNNKIPEASIPVKQDKFVHVLEKSKPNYKVEQLSTNDLDRDVPFHTVKCVHKDPNSDCAKQFYIKDNIIYVNLGGNHIDRDEGPDRYQCTLSCSDNPNHEQGGVSNPVVPDLSFIIKLDDINDHTPTLHMNTTKLKCYENIKADTTIHDIIAEDIDEGLNAEIHFLLLGAEKTEDDKDYKDLFELNYNISEPYWYVDKGHKRARLRAVKDLKDHYGLYNITMELSDRGTPQLQQVQWILLDVQRFNFEAPRFIYPAENQQFRLQTYQKSKSQLILHRRGEGLRNFSATDNSKSGDCKKWNLLITFDTTDADFFAIDQSEPCSAQLQVKSGFESEFKKDLEYKLRLTARIKDKPEGENPIDGEQTYETKRIISVMFTNQTEEPIFKGNSWSFDFFEKNISQEAKIPHKADYEHPDESEGGVFYYISTNDDRIRGFFSLEETSGQVSLKKELDYEVDEEFIFQIVASNSKNKVFSYNPKSYLNVTVKVIGINFYTPEWKKPKFYGVIMKGYQKGFPVAEVTATDRDKIDKDKLQYEILGDFKKVGKGLENLPNELFTLNPATGEVKLNFQADGSMSGYIEFTVQVHDHQDPYGHGPHYNHTTVTIFFITTEYLVKFKFLNTKEEVLKQEEHMLEIVSEIIGYNAYRQDIEVSNNTDQMGNLTTYTDLFFINEKGSPIEVVEKSEISRIISNWNTYVTMVKKVKSETGLQLIGFESNTTPSEDLHEVLRASLIAVTVVLGLLCIVLLILFVIKVRQLNNRIAKLVNKKFGSEESGLNRIGVGLPNSNKHAVEGSNPIFSINDTMKEKDFHEYDRKSISSGDSDLVGIENNPEFDYNFQKKKK